MGGTCCTYGEKRNTYRFLMARNEKQSLLGRSRRRWKGLREIGWEGEDRTDVVHVRDTWRAFVNRVTNIRVPYNEGKFLDFLRTCWCPKQDSAPCS
jgi:hypothetical protein